MSNVMTDQEQVVKDLECCIKAQCENCCNLGSWHEQWNCMTDLMKKALSLIREITAENERLTIKMNAFGLTAKRLTEVRHGEWIEKDDGWDGVLYTCSACGCDWTTIDGTPFENNMRYCPECGAKMDGERREQ